MSDGREIIRRILMVVGAATCIAMFFAGLGILVDASGDDDRLLGTGIFFGSIAAFYLWRWTVNWVLLYEDKRPP